MQFIPNSPIPPSGMISKTLLTLGYNSTLWGFWPGCIAQQMMHWKNGLKYSMRGATGRPPKRIGRAYFGTKSTIHEGTRTFTNEVTVGLCDFADHLFCLQNKSRPELIA